MRATGAQNPAVMAPKNRVDCRTCVHFREAPWQAPHTGCYLAKNMSVRQTDAYLDQQQIPGDHEKINLRGDCPDHVAKPEKPSLWKRLLAG